MTKYRFLAIALLLSGSLGLALPGCDRDQTGDQSKAKGTGSERAGKTGDTTPSQGPGGPGSGQGSSPATPGPGPAGK
ncbi:MAG TPA: hypothetical protein VFU31_17410 [Candidatus Binatia bacterium]|nr:hypothetical protein [Candidatus Binatia bacterium]